MKKYTSPEVMFMVLSASEDILITSVGQGEDYMYKQYDFGELDFDDKISF